MVWMITGGAGYIGAHVVRQLRAARCDLVVYDDLSNGDVRRLPGDIPLCRGTLNDRRQLNAAMRNHRVTGVINLAARKSVPESTEFPLWYFRENMGGFMTLLEAMADNGVCRMVQSSSAAVYGAAPGPVHTEDTPPAPLSPYATGKLWAEGLLRDIATAGGMSYLALRYFNPVGAAAPELADTGGQGLLPTIFRAIDRGDTFTLTGDDFSTRDGTGLRDYIHIEDLAQAHVAAVQHVQQRPCATELNIGTGVGHTVFEVLDTVRAVTGQSVPYRVVSRRPGDPDGAVASVDLSERLLSWRAQRDLKEMIRDAWAAWRAPRCLTSTRRIYARRVGIDRHPNLAAQR